MPEDNFLTVSYSNGTQVFPALHNGQEYANGCIPNYAFSSIYYKDLPPRGSPPWRPDDKDGHYVFAVGDSLTPRCKYSNFDLNCVTCSVRYVNLCIPKFL